MSDFGLSTQFRKYLAGEGLTSLKPEIASAEMMFAVNRALHRLTPEYKHKSWSVDGELPPLWPSDSSKCIRQTLFRMYGAKGEPFTPKARLTFFIGNFLEATMKALMKMSGFELESSVKTEVTIGGKKRRGEYDGIIKCPDGETRIFEMKTTSRYGYQSLQRHGVSNDFGYRGQINSYIRQAANDNKITVPEAVYFGMDRDTQDFDDFKVEFDPVIADENDKQFEKLEDLYRRKKMISRPVKRSDKPDRNGNYKIIMGELDKGDSLPLVCGYCQYKHTCWTEPLMDIDFDEEGEPLYSEKPELVLKLHKGSRPTWYVTAPLGEEKVLVREKEDEANKE